MNSETTGEDSVRPRLDEMHNESKEKRNMKRTKAQKEPTAEETKEQESGGGKEQERKIPTVFLVKKDCNNAETDPLGFNARPGGNAALNPPGLEAQLNQQRGRMTGGLHSGSTGCHTLHRGTGAHHSGSASRPVSEAGSGSTGVSCAEPDDPMWWLTFTHQFETNNFQPPH